MQKEWADEGILEGRRRACSIHGGGPAIGGEEVGRPSHRLRPLHGGGAGGWGGRRPLLQRALRSSTLRQVMVC